MATRHPGRVRSDRQAFQQIETRFRDEVGRVLAGIDFENGPVPFWSLLRMMFPVAESLADLIYRKDKATAENLKRVLESDFHRVRPAYSGKAALLTLLYRHSLAHHDELRVLRSGNREISWMVTSTNDGNHMVVTEFSPNRFSLVFQPRAFYDDILQVCQKAGRKRWSGLVQRRYNGWMEVDLDVPKAPRSVVEAKAELAKL